MCVVQESGSSESSERDASVEMRQVRQVQASRAVMSWRQLGEVTQLLQASMGDVERRWADGKGPLADVLAPAQLRTFVRALFQNNSRRAALLAKIKDNL